MKNLIKMTPLLLLVTVLSSSCEKYFPLPISPEAPPDSVKVDSVAILTWTGEYEVDGCGFFVDIDSVRYKPQNEDFIDDSFKRSASPNGIEVVVKYKKLAIEKAFYCGDVPEPQVTLWIEVFSLKRR